jgi:aromatic amino acid aminotransferase I / 2-aminoadipate transaminase
LCGKPVEKSDNTERNELDGTTAYIACLPPSFLSLDRSGRVVRLDSVSKILAPGLRAGWVTASDQIIDKFISYHEVSTVAVSGPTQLMLWHLLDVTWGHLGFFSWLDHLSLQYRTRLRILLKACDSYLPKDVCEWIPPQNGMFLWISLNLLRAPIFHSEGKKDIDTLDMAAQCREIEANILSKALENGVQITKGSLFDTNKMPDTALHFRLTYAAADDLEFEEGVKNFANAVREELSLEPIC